VFCVGKTVGGWFNRLSPVIQSTLYWNKYVYDVGTFADNSSAAARQVSLGQDDYDYDYDYETTELEGEEALFDAERLNIEYVDDFALAAAGDDERQPAQMEFELDKTRHGATNSHRRRRPHARFVDSFCAFFLCLFLR